MKWSDEGNALVATPVVLLFVVLLAALMAYGFAVIDEVQSIGSAPLAEAPVVQKVVQVAQAMEGVQALAQAAQAQQEEIAAGVDALPNYALEDWQLDILTECYLAEQAEEAAFVLRYAVGDHEVRARKHAEVKHGTVEVEEARASFGQNDPRRRQRKCPESDRIVNITPLANGMWAIMVEGLTSHLELTCWQVSAKDIEDVWTRVLVMHRCEPDAEQRRIAHDFFDTLPR